MAVGYRFYVPMILVKQKMLISSLHIKRVSLYIRAILYQRKSYFIVSISCIVKVHKIRQVSRKHAFFITGAKLI